MVGFCALVLMHLCASPQSAPVLSFNASWYTQEMVRRNARAHEVQIQTGLSADINLSDFLFEVPSSKVSKSCSDTLCVYYRRHCEVLKCEYVWADYGADLKPQSVVLNKRLSVSARTPEELKGFQGNLSFVSATDEAENVPLGNLKVSDLAYESPDTNVIQFIERKRGLGTSPAATTK